MQTNDDASHIGVHFSVGSDGMEESQATAPNSNCASKVQQDVEHIKDILDSFASRIKALEEQLTGMLDWRKEIEEEEIRLWHEENDSTINSMVDGDDEVDLDINKTWGGNLRAGYRPANRAPKRQRLN